MMDDAPNQMLKKTDKFRSQFTMDNINNSIGQTMCKPVTKFGYLKTHKCGSTTIQNILLRYVVKHGLNVVLPENGEKYVSVLEIICVNFKFLHDFLQGPFVDLSPDPKLWRRRPILRPGQNYSVFCLHTMWDHDHVKELIGDQGRGAKYFSIVRDPVDVFISKWDYYGFSKAFKMDLETFATNKSISFREKKKNKKEVKLGMMLDDFFGLPEGNLYNKSAVVAKIAQIDADFDLIMVMERFDESLVLLRELLCWDWGDMTYFKKNSWQDTRRSALSQEGRARLKEWLWGDYLLYDHFKKRFDETIRKYNDNMEWDLEKLRTLNLNIESQCVKVGIYYIDNDCR